jgi:hypothetical protein
LVEFPKMLSPFDTFAAVAAIRTARVMRPWLASASMMGETAEAALLAVADSYLTVAAFAVGAVVVVLLVVALRNGRGRGGYEASPPRTGQQDYRKPHD